MITAHGKRHLGHTVGDNLGMRLMLRSIAWLGARALLPLAACSGGATGHKFDIKIGVDMPLSGVEGRAGTPTLNGVRFFVHQHPVLDGFSVGISALDDAVKGVHDAKLGTQNITAFVNDPLVLGVIGPFDSNVARSVIPLANPSHLAMISP